MAPRKDTKAKLLAELIQTSKVAPKSSKDKKTPVVPDLSVDEFDSDLDLYEDSEDGLFYEDDVDGLFGEDDSFMLVEDADDSDIGSGEMIEDGEYSEESDEDEDVDLEEEVPALIPVSAEDTGVKYVKTVKSLQDKTSPNKFDFLTQGRVAIKALTDVSVKKDEKKSLFPESNGVFLHVTYKLPLHPDTKRIGSRRYFEMPFSEKSALNSSLCLILPDLSHTKKDLTDPEVDKQSKMWSDILREKFSITGRDVAKVFTLSQLRREYKTQEEKRKFGQTYDVILVDRTVISPVIYHLQRWAQKQGRMPLPFNVTAKNVPEQIRRAYRLGQLSLKPGNADVIIKIGNLTQSATHLAANFTSATECLFKHIPGGEANIRLADIRTDMSKVVLPIYVDFGSKKDVVMPEIVLSKPAAIIEDLDTLPLGYRIKMDGLDFTVVDEDGNEVAYPFDDDDVNPLDDIPVPTKAEFVREKVQELKKAKVSALEAEKKKDKSIAKEAKSLKRKEVKSSDSKPPKKSKIASPFGDDDSTLLDDTPVPTEVKVARGKTQDLKQKKAVSREVEPNKGKVVAKQAKNLKEKESKVPEPKPTKKSKVPVLVDDDDSDSSDDASVPTKAKVVKEKAQELKKKQVVSREVEPKKGKVVAKQAKNLKQKESKVPEPKPTKKSKVPVLVDDDDSNSSDDAPVPTRALRGKVQELKPKKVVPREAEPKKSKVVAKDLFRGVSRRVKDSKVVKKSK